MSRTIVIATGNTGKLREILDVLDSPPGALAEFRTLSDYPALPKPTEDGATFSANAEIKARHYARLTGQWVLADDSGLEVDALRGAPGVHSARYAGDAQDDAANNGKLIAALAGVPPHKRAARFRCAMVLASPERMLASVMGKVEGRIIDPPRGGGGFGYDPHFLIPELGLTAAELSAEQKNDVSHRGAALRRMKREIEKSLTEG